MNAKLKLWIIVSLVAVFAIGVGVGYFGERYIVHGRRDARPHFPTVETMAKDLGLSREQQDRIREIFKNNETRLEAFGTEFHKRLGELRGQLMDEIKAVLTPEQTANMEARIRAYMEKHRKDRGPDKERKGEAR